MLTRLLMLIGVAGGITVLLTGAWPGPLDQTPQPAESRFIPQPIALDDAIVGQGISAAELVHKAIEKLEPARIAWLRTRMRQTIVDAQGSRIIEGLLQRGPNHCARLEMKAGSRRVTTISDGNVAARVLNVKGQSQVEATESLPATQDLAGREAFLRERGCGGPVTLLRLLEPSLASATLQTGTLGETPVIRIRMDAPPSMPHARLVEVYLDAKTLWPRCVEWWNEERSRWRCATRMEFLEEEIDRILSPEECERVFSYRPT